MAALLNCRLKICIYVLVIICLHIRLPVYAFNHGGRLTHHASTARMGIKLRTVMELNVEPRKSITSSNEDLQTPSTSTPTSRVDGKIIEAISGEMDRNGDGEYVLSPEEDEALIIRLEEEIRTETGFELDQLINPAKVVNLERDLVKLNFKLASGNVDTTERMAIEETIAQKKSVIQSEKRLIMRGWLKNLFVGQSVLSAIIAYGMASNSIPGFDLPLQIQVLGFWMWWLFIIPSLRARKPAYEEKEALNIAFLASPVVSILMPTFTKDPVAIYWGNVVTIAICYAYAYLKPQPQVGEGGDSGESILDEGKNSALPSWIIKAYKALDYGSGQERGARK